MFTNCSRCLSRRLPSVSISPTTCVKELRTSTNKQQHWYQAALTTPPKHTEELTEIMCNSVVYENENLIAFNKPIGIPTGKNDILKTTAEEHDHEAVTMTDCLPNLEEKFGGPLSFFFQQDHTCSGLTLALRNSEIEEKLRKYIRHVKTTKSHFASYWALTVGTPRPKNGEETLKIEKTVIKGNIMSIAYESRSDILRKERNVTSVHFKYRVLREQKDLQAALVEILCNRTRWQSMQVLLTEKLSPILGDHRYSSRVKHVLGSPVLVDPTTCTPEPQVLPKDWLKRLGLKKEDVPKVPLHLHCRELKIPATTNKKAPVITIQAPLPQFYLQTLASLDLKTPLITASKEEESLQRASRQ